MRIWRWMCCRRERRVLKSLNRSNLYLHFFQILYEYLFYEFIFMVCIYFITKSATFGSFEVLI